MKKITFKYVPILALVLLFLATGQVNAGDVTTLYAKALTAANPYSVWDTEGWNPTTNLTIDGTNGLTLKGTTTNVSSTLTLSPQANTIITYEFVWYDNTGDYNSYSEYTQLYICNNLAFT